MSQTDHKTPCVAAAPATSAPPDGAGAAERPPQRRFSTKRKADAVQRLLRGESLEAVSRDIGVPASRLSEWRDRFLAGAESAFKEQKPGSKDDETARLKAMARKATSENQLLRKKIRRLEKGVPYHLQKSRK